LHAAVVFAWDDLKYFLAFGRTGGMLAAAKALGVNQSTVQRRITELESRLGRRLVARHAGGYRLTALGQDLLPAAEQVETAALAFDRAVAASDNGLAGTIRVTTGVILAARLRHSKLIDMFHARHPGLRVALLTSDRFLDLAKGEADIAIRAGDPADETLVGRKIADAPWAIFASPSYVERHGAPRRVEDIERHFVVGCVGTIANYQSANWLRSVAPHATVAAGCDNWSGLVSAVKSGAGIAPLLAYQEDSELVRVIDRIDLLTPFYLLMHRDMQRTPRVRAFADFVASEIGAFRALVSG
jgi:DNA-binding transcriptional LysR family regulator